MTAIERTVGCSALLLALLACYSLVRALLSRRDGYHPSLQIAVAAGLAIVYLGFIILGFSHALWGFDFWRLAIALGVFAALSLILTVYVQRREQGSHPQSSQQSERAWSRVAHGWHRLSRQSRLSWAFLGLTVVASAGLASFLFNSRQETFTEFFVDPARSGQDQPWHQELEAGHQLRIPVTVISHEASPKELSLHVSIDGQLNHVVGLGTLEPGQKTASNVAVAIDEEGPHRVDVGLFRNGDSSPYRAIRIWVRVGSTNRP